MSAIFLLLLVGIPIGIIVYLIVMYNRLVALRNNREQAFADIDVQLQQRYDLVPNLVNTVKGYAKHETELFEKVTQARAQALGAQTVDEKIEAENQFSSALKSIIAIGENYPELKANQNFLHLQAELADIENKIASARRFFNNATKEYNTSLQAFPANLFASMFGFKQGKFFEIAGDKDEVRKNVKVEF